MRYTFKAVDISGAPFRGEMEADTKLLAVEQLLTAGHTPLLLQESDSAPFHYRLFQIPHGGRNASLRLVQEMAVLLNAGLPIERVLIVLKSLASDRHLSAGVSQALERVRAGEPLSQALIFLLPTRNAAQFQQLIAAGEASGHLPDVISRLSATLERRKTLRDHIISSLAYPAFLIGTLTIVMWVVFADVVPRLAPVFRQAHHALPGSTRILLALSDILTGYGWAIAVVLAGAATALTLIVRRPAVRLSLHRMALSSRLALNIIATYEAAAFCHNLATLLSGGLAMDRALAAARATVGNVWFARALGRVQERVEDGDALARAFSDLKFLPRLVIEFMAVGEETGRLADMLQKAGDTLARDVEVRLDRLTALILPASTLVMGILVAGVMGAVVSGLIAINDVVL